MGYNTVAVLLNDQTNRMPDEMRHSVRSAAVPFDRLQLDFGYGRVISQAHADDSQVVIVARNSGELARNAEGVDPWALEQMKMCLERHGYRVTKSYKSKP